MQTVVLRAPNLVEAQRKFKCRQTLAVARRIRVASHDYIACDARSRRDGLENDAHDATESSIWANIGFGRCCPF